MDAILNSIRKREISQNFRETFPHFPHFPYPLTRMNTHALIAEETGYQDSRLSHPPSSHNPHYLRGYRQGERDNLTFQGLWEAYQFLKTSETVSETFLNQFRNSQENLCKLPEH